MSPKGAVNYKYAPNNVFPDDPTHPHGLRLSNSPAECCQLCQGLSNCSFFTYSAGEAGGGPTCYGKPGGCCFLKTAAGGIPAPGCAGCTSGSSEAPPPSPLKSRLEVLWGERDFRRYQSGQPTVFSGAYIITMPQYVYTWLILQICGRSAPTGTFG